jgi:hypothetical protein
LVTALVTKRNRHHSRNIVGSAQVRRKADGIAVAVEVRRNAEQEEKT